LSRPPTSIRQIAARRLHRFSWLNEWKERANVHGQPLGIELIRPDWGELNAPVVKAERSAGLDVMPPRPDFRSDR
jgi:plasmid replication initiation protein